MSIKFTPKTEKEIAESQLWPKGIYDFEVVKAEPAVSGQQSKNPGTEFIKLNVQVFDSEGRFRYVNGILHPAMEAQLRHFCQVGGLLAKYESGTLESADCVGVSGKLKLKIKDAQGDYPAKNEIADFVTEKNDVANKLETAKPVKAKAEGDEVPF